ncbi:hypothetical protein [uncultured Citrobacter sp.]|uniref:hypothetical protein n=1 Tax=Enterobacter sp. TaxID=42895 RepID=UPI0035A71F0D
MLSINTVRIGGEVKHITGLDALTLMHEWSRLKKENAHLYDYNRKRQATAACCDY